MKKMIMIFGTCAWVSTAFGSNEEPEYHERLEAAISALGNTGDVDISYSITSYTLASGSDVSYFTADRYSCPTVGAYSVSEVVHADAKRFVEQHQIPECLSDAFAHEMSRKPLRDVLVSLIVDASSPVCQKAVADLNEDILTQLLRNIFLINPVPSSDYSSRARFLEAYAVAKDFDKAANMCLKGSVTEEILAKATLPLKLRAISLRDRVGINLQDTLERTVSMEEERALSILTFFNKHPEAYTSFRDAESGFSTPYLLWLSTFIWTSNISGILQLGELDEERRRMLEGPEPHSVRADLVDKWLREKNTAA
ncbi:MAG: hypothetical protein LCH26_08845 [Proteobacteria bacterium]|nr:hypothetical protein [Pseudomonadota bacterium]